MKFLTQAYNAPHKIHRGKKSKAYKAILSCWSGFSKRLPKHSKIFLFSLAISQILKVKSLLLKVPHAFNTGPRGSDWS